MSRVIIEDTGQLWVISGAGDIKWQGTVNGMVDLQLVGPLDTVTANAVTVYAGAETTGFHYKAGVVTTFPGFDGLEAFEAAWYWAVGAFLLVWVVRIVSKMLANKEAL